MNKKGGLIGTVIVIILAILLVWFILIPAIGNTTKEYNDYQEYKEFCEDREDFCYCDTFECSFRVEYRNGNPTRDTRAYCKLAEELEDKGALFNGRCNQ